MKKVLVVDDETSITDGLLALFELEQIDASGAYDRESAELLLEKEFYPVVLADLRLKSEAEGMALLDSIRRLSPLSKVATLTAYATPEVEEELRRRGSSMVLRKPMDFDQIIAIIGELLGEIEQAADAQQAITNQPLDLTALYADVSKVLHAIPARRYGMTAEETEELVQEAWLLFLEKRQSVLEAKPWFSGVMVNLCKQRIHKNQKGRERTREVTAKDEEQIPSREGSSVETLMVREALKKLDDRSRQLCVLIGLEGFSYDEVSAELGLPLGSVGPLYIRAKNKLKNALSN